MTVDAAWIARELEVTTALAANLAAFVRLLMTWNQRINLTAARSAEQVVREHVADSVAVLAHVPADAARAIDVGSGGGFPGIVVGAARPDLDLTLLEPVHKKQAFLAAAIRELGLARCRARAMRVEDYLREAGAAGAADVAMSRATWAVSEWLERGRALVRPGGLVLGFEGREQADLPAGAQRHPVARGDRARAILALRA
jgi:16S rRNA (guanine527-N7)-methyltransferase